VQLATTNAISKMAFIPHLLKRTEKKNESTNGPRNAVTTC